MSKKAVAFIILCIIVGLAATQLFVLGQTFDLRLLFAGKTIEMGFRITLLYHNGQVEVIDCRDSPKAMLLNPSTGMPISMVTVEVYIIGSLQNVESYSCLGSLKMQIIEDATGKACYVRDIQLAKAFDMKMEPLKAMVVYKQTMLPNTLEAMWSGWQEWQKYRLSYECEYLTVTVQYQNGQTETLKPANLPVKAELTFRYTRGSFENINYVFY